MAEVIEMPPTTQERYRHFRENAEAFVQSMEAMIQACERDGNADLASKLTVWCLNPWQATLRDDDSGDLWFNCEACGKPIKDDVQMLWTDDGCTLHKACVDR